MRKLINQWNEALLSVGLSAINSDTCARILAVIYVYGNNEEFVLNEKLNQDLNYIQRRFGLYGMGVPDVEFAQTLRKYIEEINAYEKEHQNEMSNKDVLFESHIPAWAVKLYQDRYGITIR